MGKASTQVERTWISTQKLKQNAKEPWSRPQAETGKQQMIGHHRVTLCLWTERASQSQGSLYVKLFKQVSKPSHLKGPTWIKLLSVLLKITSP